MIPSSSAAAASFRLSFNNSTSSARGPFRDLTGVSNSNLKLVFEDAVKQSGVHYQSVSNLITHAGSLVQSVIGKSETDSAKRTENPASGELSQASVENHAEVLLNSRAEGGIPLNEKIVNALKSLPTGEQFVVHKATTAKDALFNEIKESPSTFILSEKTLAKFKSLVENNSGMGNSKALKSVEDFMTIRHEIKSRLSPDDSKTLTELNKVTRSFISSIVKNGVGVNSPAAGSSKHADALNKHKQICSKLIALDKQSSALSYNVEIANRIGESLIKAGLTQDECAEVMASANNLFRDSIEENDSILSTINRSNHLSSFEQTQTRLGQESITFDLLKNALADIAKPKADDAADSGPGPEVKVEPSKEPGVHVTINAPFNFTYHEGNKGSEGPGTASESQPAFMATPDTTQTDDPIAPQLAAVGVGALPEEMDSPAHSLQNPQRRAMANVSDSSLQHTPDHSEQESQTTSAVESPRQSVSRDSGDIGDVGNELRHDVIDSATGPAVESMRQDEKNTVSTDRTDQASGTDGNPTLVRSPVSSYIGGPGSSSARTNPAEARRTAQSGVRVLNSQGTQFQGMNGGQTSGTPASMGTSGVSQGVGTRTAPGVASVGTGTHNPERTSSRGTGSGQVRGVAEDTVPSASPTSSYIGGPGSSSARTNPAEARRTAQSGARVLNSQGTQFQGMNGSQTTGTPASTGTSRSSEGVGLNTAPGSLQGVGINTAPGTSQNGASNTAAGGTSRGTGTEDLSQSPGRGQARGVMEETVPSASPASSYIGGPGSSGARANPAEARRTAQGAPGALNSQGTPFQGMNGGQTTGTPASTGTSRLSQGVGINTAPGSSQSGGSNTAAGGTSRGTGTEDLSQGPDRGQARGVMEETVPSASPASSYIGGPGSSGARANPAEARRTAQGGPGALNSQGTQFQGMNGGQTTGTPASTGTSGASQRAGITTTPGSSQGVGINTAVGSSQSGGSNTAAGGTSRGTGTEDLSQGPDRGQARGVMEETVPSASPASSYIGGPGSSGARANPAEARRTALGGPGALNSQGTPFQGMNGGQTTGTPALTGTSRLSQGVGINTAPGSSQGVGINTTPGSSQNGGSNTAAGGTSRGTGTEDLSQSPDRGQARGVKEETVPSASPASSYIGGPGSSGARANPAEARRTAQGGPGILNSQGTPFQGMNGGQTTGTPASTSTSRSSQGVEINTAPGGTSRSTGSENPERTSSPGVDNGQARGVTGGAAPSASPASSYIGGPGSSGARANPAEARRTAQGGPGALNSQGTPFQGMNGGQKTGTPASIGTTDLSQSVGNNTPSVSSQSGGSNTTAGGASRRTGTQNPERTSSPGVDNGRARGVTGGAASSASPTSSYIGGPGSSGACANPAEARRTAQEGPGALNSQGTPFQGMNGGQTTGTPASTGTTDSSQGVGLNTTPGSSQGAGINTTPGSSQNGGSNTAAGGTSRGTGTEDLSQRPGRGQARGVMEETVPSASPASSYIGGPGSSGARANPAEARRTAQGGPGALNSQGTPFQGMNIDQTTGTSASTGTSGASQRAGITTTPGSSQGVGINTTPGSSQNGGSNTAAGGTSRGTGTEDLSQSSDRGQARGVKEETVPSASPASSYIGGPGSSGARANPAEARRTAQKGTGALNSQGTPFQGMNGGQKTVTSASTGITDSPQGVGNNTPSVSSQSGGSNTTAGGASRRTGTQNPERTSSPGVDNGRARGVTGGAASSASPTSSYIGGPGSSGARANPAEARRTAQGGPGALNSQGTPFQGMNDGQTTGTPASTSTSRSSQGVGNNTPSISSQSGGSNTTAGGASRRTGTQNPERTSSPGVDNGRARGVTGGAASSASPTSSYIGGPGSSGARANPAEARRTAQGGPGALNSQGTPFQGMNDGQTTGTPASTSTSRSSQGVGNNTPSISSQSGGSNTAAGGTSRSTGSQNPERTSSPGVDNGQARGVTGGAASSASPASSYIGGPGSSGARANPAEARRTAQGGPGTLNSQGTPFQGMNGGQTTGTPASAGTSGSSQNVGLNTTHGSSQGVGNNTPSGSSQNGGSNTAAGGTSRGTGTEDLSQSPDRGQARGVTGGATPSTSPASSYIGGPGSSGARANPAEARRTAQGGTGGLNSQGTPFQGMNGDQTTGTPALTGTSRLSQGVGINTAPGSSQSGGSNTAAGGISRGTGTEDLSQSSDRGQARGVMEETVPSASPASSYIGGPGSSGARANPAEARRTAQKGTGALNSQGTPFQGMNGVHTTGTPAFTSASRSSQGIGINTTPGSSQSGGSNTVAGGTSRATGTEGPSQGSVGGQARGVTGSAMRSATPASSYIGGPGSSGARANPAEAQRMSQRSPGALNSQGTLFQGMNGGRPSGTPVSAGTSGASQRVGTHTAPVGKTAQNRENASSRGTDSKQARDVTARAAPSVSSGSPFIGGPGSSSARANPAQSRLTAQSGPGALNSQGTPFQGMNGGRIAGAALRGNSTQTAATKSPRTAPDGSETMNDLSLQRGIAGEQTRGVTTNSAPSATTRSSSIGGAGSSIDPANPTEVRRSNQDVPGQLNRQGTYWQGLDGKQASKMTPEKMNNSSSFIGSRGSSQAMPNFNGVSKTTVKK